MTLFADVASFPSWHPHLDTWVLMGLLGGAYVLAVRYRRRSHPGSTSRRQVFCFTAGVAVLWLASDWPVHDVAEGYLYSVHMFQHLLMTLVGAGLLVLGTPEWMARRVLSPRWLLATVRWLSRPVPALIQFNLVLVVSHVPAVVEGTIRNHPLHFVAHAVLLVSAVLMWFPIVSPLREVPRLSAPMQMLYLFLQTILPTVPASFLTFGQTPLYEIYETFPRLWGIPVLEDQLVAGLLMKIGGGLFIWSVIAVVFFRWYAREEAKPSDVLLWEDVERELRTLESRDQRSAGQS
ncbi:MAG: cytochrome c oxidase assembly protein [Actinomycetota bacterium]|nr:cytochrome c oxidase assembly protein [Actinomycetota bacterium]